MGHCECTGAKLGPEVKGDGGQDAYLRAMTRREYALVSHWGSIGRSVGQSLD